MMKNIGFPIDDELYSELRILCYRKGKTLKDFLTEMIKKTLQEQESKNE